MMPETMYFATALVWCGGMAIALLVADQFERNERNRK